MIARLHRFHGYGSLRGVYTRGQTVRSSWLSLKFSKRDAKYPYRLAVVVSRKVNKSAVVRNRIRRRIYEISRRQEQQFPPGLDMIFTVFSSELATMEADKLEKVVAELLKKAIYPTQADTRGSAQPRGIVKNTRE